jgi:hypothetical protein
MVWEGSFLKKFPEYPEELKDLVHCDISKYYSCQHVLYSFACLHVWDRQCHANSQEAIFLGC